MSLVNLDETMDRLRALGNETVRARNVRSGAGENQFGVTSGDLRALAKELKANPELAAALWRTGNLDAMLLATLLMRPKQLSAEELEALAGSVTNAPLADWLGTHVVKLHPEKESLRVKWLELDAPMLRRAGWSLTAERIVKNPDGLDLSALLDRIEHEMAGEPEVVQWTMNYCLAETGIRFPEHRARAIAIGEKLGAFRDYPTSKGCTSPYAPIWIAEMVSRQAG